MSKFRTGRFGAIMYTSLSSNLYNSLTDVCREYIANEIDSRTGEEDDLKIDISFGIHNFKNSEGETTKKIKSITIFGNGNGMTYDQLNTDLHNLGTSSKRNNPDAIGKYGLGLHAGTLVCHMIKIETKIKGSKEVVIAELPVNEWLEKAEANPNLLLNELIEGNIYSQKVEISEHEMSFTKIILHDMKGGYGELSQIKLLQNNLPMVLPVENEKNASSKDYLEKLNFLYLQANASIPSNIKLIIDGEKMLRPFNVPSSFAPIYGVIPSKARGDKVLAIYWVNHHEKALKPDYFRGVDIFQKGISVIRPENWKNELKQLGKHATHWNAYPRVKMDVFILRGNIHPRVQRDRFEYTSDWETVLDESFAIFKQIMVMAYNAKKSNNKSNYKFSSSTENHLKSMSRTNLGKIYRKNIEGALDTISGEIDDDNINPLTIKKYENYVLNAESHNFSSGYLYLIKQLLKDWVSITFQKIEKQEFEVESASASTMRLNGLSEILIKRKKELGKDIKELNPLSLLNIKELSELLASNKTYFNTIIPEVKMNNALKILVNVSNMENLFKFHISLEKEKIKTLGNNFNELIKIFN